MLNFDRFDLTAKSNPKLQRLTELYREPASRRVAGAFVFTGAHGLAEAIKARAPLESLFISPRFLERADGRALRAAVESFYLFTLPDSLLGSALSMPNHQGIAGICRLPEGDIPAPGPLALLAAGVQDPGNLGALVRAADAFKAAPVLVLTGGADPYGAKAVAASAGSLFRLWPRQVSLEELQGWLDKHTANLYGCDAHAGAELGLAKLQRPAMLAIGQEGAGLPKELLPLLTNSVHLPLPGEAESLNAAQAGALALFLAGQAKV